jgi:hypothetical protein
MKFTTISKILNKSKMLIIPSRSMHYKWKDNIEYFEVVVLECVDCISFCFAYQGFVSIFNMLIE